MLEHIKERETEESSAETGDVRTGLGRLQTTHRYTMTIPWVAPFADPEIFETSGSSSSSSSDTGARTIFVIVCYHSNNPYPRQRVPTLASRYIDRSRHPPHRTRKDTHRRRQVPAPRDVRRQRQHRSPSQYAVSGGPGPREPIRRDPHDRPLSILASSQHEKGFDVGSGCPNPPSRNTQYLRRSSPGTRRLLLPTLLEHRPAYGDDVRTLRWSLGSREGVVGTEAHRRGVAARSALLCRVQEQA